jgi:hypothetical protein
MNEYDRDYIDRVKADLAHLSRVERRYALIFGCLVLMIFWTITVAALLGFLA